MRRFLNILILISLYLVFGSRSCVDESAHAEWQKKEADAAKDSIRVELESDYLSEEARYAAEIKAIQELNDFADYVEIFADKSLDSHFREKAGEMISDLFISEDAGLSVGPIKNKKMNPVTVKDFLNKGFGKDVLRVKLFFDSLHIASPLTKSGVGNYSGTISGYQRMIQYHSSDSTIISPQSISVGFVSSRQSKIIGRDTLMVWEVSLSKMAKKF